MPSFVLVLKFVTYVKQSAIYLPAIAIAYHHHHHQVSHIVGLLLGESLRCLIPRQEL